MNLIISGINQMLLCVFNTESLKYDYKFYL